MTFFVLLSSDNAGLDHFPVKVITLTSTFTHTSEDGETTVALGDVVDELHDDDGLADTPAPPKAPTLPPLVKGQIRSITLMPVSRI
jgi:hypothetical protein